MTKIKKGDKVQFKGREYTVFCKLLNYVIVEDDKGNKYKISYSNITVIDETTHS